MSCVSGFARADEAMLDFLGIGAQKAGTTWLYEQLSRHPQILFPAGKEVHFWDRADDPDPAWYRQRFAQDTGSGIRQGEITPAYAFIPRLRIEQIRALYPGLRLIYLIRNPIERAWSSALMALGRAEMQIDEASDQWFIDHFQSRGSLGRGDYEVCIRNWRSVYPDGQLLILLYESIAREPLVLLQRVADHLRIDPAFYLASPADELRRRVFAGSGHPLRPSLRPVLEEIYREKILSLQHYLGLRFEWDTRSGQ
jgi:hypothetical protein